MSMDPELDAFRRFAEARAEAGGGDDSIARKILKLFDNRDDLAREVERLREDSRIQGVILADVGEALGAGAEVSPVDAARRVRGEAERLRGERDAARMARAKSVFELGAKVRDGRSCVRVAHEGRTTLAHSTREVVEAWGWGYLYGEADAPEGQPKLSRRLADLGAADLWRPFRVALLGSDTVHTWKYQGRFEESFGGVEVAWRFLDEDGEHHNLHHPDWRLCPAPAPDAKSVDAILGKLPSDETDAEFLDMLEEQPPHEGECRVKLGPSRDGWVCSKGTLGCIGEQP